MHAKSYIVITISHLIDAVEAMLETLVLPEQQTRAR
jgi:hypothetical protein